MENITNLTDNQLLQLITDDLKEMRGTDPARYRSNLSKLFDAAAEAESKNKVLNFGKRALSLIDSLISENYTPEQITKAKEALS